MTASQPLLDSDFHGVSRKSVEDPGNETDLCFSGESTSCLGKKSTVPFKALSRHNYYFVSWVKKRSQNESLTKFCSFSPE